MSNHEDQKLIEASKDTGGPAFVIRDVGDCDRHGLTKREYFAAHAPSVPDSYGIKKRKVIEDNGKNFAEVTRDELALTRITRWNFEYADAMIAESKK